MSEATKNSEAVPDHVAARNQPTERSQGPTTGHRGVRIGSVGDGTETLTEEMKNKNIAIDIRQATKADRAAIVALDAEVTGTEKPKYWTDILDRFAGHDQQAHSCFLVATSEDDKIVGLIVGEIRAWEFGSPPCGWILVVTVTPVLRESGIGSLLLEALCTDLREAGVTTIRTMVLGNDKVNLSFFRSAGLAAGPYIELEKRVD